jgi:hypothetical protein
MEREPFVIRPEMGAKAEYEWLRLPGFDQVPVQVKSRLRKTNYKKIFTLKNGVIF